MFVKIITVRLTQKLIRTEIYKAFCTKIAMSTYPGTSGQSRFESNNLSYNKESIHKQLVGLRAKQNNLEILSDEIIEKYVREIDVVTKDYIGKILVNDNNELSDSFTDYLQGWSFESISTIALDQRLKVMYEQNKVPDLEYVKNVTQLSIGYVYGSYIKPLSWWKSKTMDNLVFPFKKQIQEATLKLEQKYRYNQNEQIQYTLLEEFLIFDANIVPDIICEMVYDGTHLSTSLAVRAMYQLANNPDKQQKLRDEIFRILSEKDWSITNQNLKQIRYLTDCVKEVLRMHPEIIAKQEELKLDKLSKQYGEDIRKHSLDLNDENFREPGKFLPERWMDSNLTEQMELYENRKFIGLTYTDVLVRILLIRLLQQFRIEWNGNPLHYSTNTGTNNKFKFKLIAL